MLNTARKHNSARISALIHHADTELASRKMLILVYPWFQRSQKASQASLIPSRGLSHLVSECLSSGGKNAQDMVMSINQAFSVGFWIGGFSAPSSIMHLSMAWMIRVPTPYQREMVAVCILNTAGMC